MKKINVILGQLPDLDEVMFELSKAFLPSLLKSINSVAFSCDENEISLLRRKYPSLYVAKSVYLHKPLKAKAEYGNLSQIGADVANKLTSGKDVKVGIIDTGIDYNHNELKERFGALKGYDFVSNSDNPLDFNGHGTHCSGIVAGKNTGVAPKCELFGLRVLDSDGKGSEVDIIKALEWAVDNHIDVCNMSFGSSHSSLFEKKAIEYALNNGVILCSAAGNSGVKEYSYPASYEGVISVAAVDSDNERASFSTMNDKICISAPGVDIVSSVPGNSYSSLSGTSMAAPHVTGVVALIKSLQDASPRAAKEIAAATAFELGDSVEYGAGLIRADEAVAVHNDNLPGFPRLPGGFSLHTVNRFLEELL